MNCEQFSMMLDEYESLSALQKAELKEHIVSCEECKCEYELFMSMLDATRTFPPIKADDSFLKNLNARIDKEVVAAPVHKNVWEHLKLNAHRYSAVAACIALVAVIGVNSTDLLDKLANPYVEDIAPITTLAPTEEDESENIGASTAEPTPSATPAQSEEPQTSLSPASTATPNVAATPKPTPKTTTVVHVFESQTPANSDEPTVSETTQSPATTQPYTVEQGGYVLPASANPIEGRTIQGEDYSPGNTSNYIKVSQADIERVRAILGTYSDNVEGSVYQASEAEMEQILEVLASEGIEFDNSISTVTDGNVAFKLIIS